MSTPKTVRAKFRVDCVIDHGGQKEAQASAVYSSKGENKDFRDATPAGELKISIWDDAPASEFFRPGQYLYLDISEAPEE